MARTLPAVLPDDLLDAVYHAALEPAAWHAVMAGMQELFPSAAQGFYFLHRRPHRIQAISQTGFTAQWLRRFDALYFAPDNPFFRVSGNSHRPGVVRTNERVDRMLRADGALYGSAYFNEWLRPQGFKYTLGNTLHADDDIVANITLMRSPAMKTFSEAEVLVFERLSRHMTRALQIGLKIERPEATRAGTAAFDAMPQAVALIDDHRRVLYANPPMEAELRRTRYLCVRHGGIEAFDAAFQPRWLAYLDAAVARDDALPESALGCGVALPHGDGRGHLNIRALPVQATAGLLSRPTLLLMATEHNGRSPESRAAIRALHGCTRREARLAQLLAQGSNLRDAASEMGVTYETARGYLKSVFAKTGVRTQSQLVARLLSEGV